MARIQYQAKADPIVVTAVVAPSADGWLQPPSQPVRQRRSAAHHASGMAPISPWALTQPETVSLDRFAPTYPDRTWRAKSSANQPSFAWSGFTPLSPDAGFSVQAAPRIPSRAVPPANQQSLAWTPINVALPLSADFGFVVAPVRCPPAKGLAPASQQSLAWSGFTPLPADAGYMVQAAPSIPRRRGATPHQQPFVSNWPVPTPPGPLALHALVTWVD